MTTFYKQSITLFLVISLLLNPQWAACLTPFSSAFTPLLKSKTPFQNQAMAARARWMHSLKDWIAPRSGHLIFRDTSRIISLNIPSPDHSNDSTSDLRNSATPFARIYKMYSPFQSRDSYLAPGGSLALSMFSERASLRMEIAELIATTLPPQAKVLSVGVGAGHLELEIAQRYPKRSIQFFGVDVTPAMLQRARNNRVLVTRSDAQKLPYADNQFDAIVLSEILGHVDPHQLVAQAQRVLKEGGYIFLFSYAPRPIRRRDYGYRPDSIGEVAKVMEENGFSDPTVLPLMTPFLPPEYYALQSVKSSQPRNAPYIVGVALLAAQVAWQHLSPETVPWGFYMHAMALRGSLAWDPAKVTSSLDPFGGALSIALMLPPFIAHQFFAWLQRPARLTRQISASA